MAESAAASTRMTREDVAHKLRQQIVAGRLKPGQQLPSHATLQQQLGASPLTLQAGMDMLRREGFVRSVPRQGTFVEDYPPHRHRFALLLPIEPTDGKRIESRYYRMLADYAEVLSARADCTIDVVYQAIDNKAPCDPQLEAQVRSHCYAGCIFLGPPELWQQRNVLAADASLTHAYLTSHAVKGKATVTTSMEEVIDRGIDWLIAHDRKHLAILANSWSKHLIDHFQQTLKARGLAVREHWMQQVHLDTAYTGKSLVHLLFHPDQAQTPDGLLISDDNLVTHATAGLIAAGVANRVGVGLDIVAHCNLPDPVPASVPVCRIGQDVRMMLLEAAKAIQSQRDGQPPSHCTLPTLFESDVEAEKVAE